MPKRPIQPLKNIFCGMMILFCLFSFAFISFYFVPNGDDFFLFSDGLRIPFWQNCRNFFLNWGIRTGTIFTLLAAHAGGRGLFAILNTTIFAALVFLLYKLALPGRKPWEPARDLPMLTLTLLLTMYGSARPRDVFFWISGAETYMWPAALATAFFFFFFCKIQRKKNLNIPAPLLVPVTFVTGILCGMANENGCIGGPLILAYLFLQERRLFRIPSADLIGGAAGFLAGMLLLTCNPGVHVRYATEIPAAVSIGERLAMLPELTAFWGFASLPQLLIAGGCAGLILFSERKDFFRRRAWRIFRDDPMLRSACLLLGCSLLMAWVFAAAHPPAIRAYFSTSLLNTIAAIKMFTVAAERFDRLPKVVLPGMTVLILCLVLPAFPDVLKINREEKARLAHVAELHRQGVRDAVLPLHSVRRNHLLQYIFVEDISPDPDFMVNQMAARYYQFDTVRSQQNYQVKTFWKKQPPPSSPDNKKEKMDK